MSEIWTYLKPWYDAQTDAFPTEEETEEERHLFEWVRQEAHVDAYYEARERYEWEEADEEEWVGPEEE